MRHFLFSAAVVSALALLLPGCASGPVSGLRGPQGSERPRPLPATGEPGRVAAADFTFARAAQEEGQDSALRRFAAPGALLHAPGGPVDAAAWLAQQGAAATALSWEPRAVWSSCDGSLAVSSGRSEEPGGLVGSYVTIWQRQDDGSYKWIYSLGGPDVPQPPRRAATPSGAKDGDAIVVSGLRSITGKVADCPRGGPAPAPPAQPAVPAGARSQAAQAKDATLQFSWEHHADGTRRLTVDYLREGAWERALDFTRLVAD